MQAESWTSLWSTWKTSGIMCWVGVIILFFQFKNDGIWLAAPIVTAIGYVAFTILCYSQVKKIKAGKFLDKRLTDKEIEKGSHRSLILAVVCMAGMLGFSIYILTQLSSSVDTEMTGSNYTHNCIEASGLIYSEKTGIPMKPSQIPFEGGIVDKAQKAWVADSCNTVMLTDTFGNQCLGNVGLAFYGYDKDANGQWYCSNIDKSIIKQKIQTEKVQ